MSRYSFRNLRHGFQIAIVIIAWILAMPHIDG